MITLFVAALGSLKVLILLLAAWGLALALRGRPARLRAAVWATALVGSLLIPAVAAVVPSFFVELPIDLPSPAAEPAAMSATAGEQPLPPPALAVGTATVGSARIAAAPPAWPMPDPAAVIAIFWGLATAFLLLQQAAGLLQMSRIVRRATKIDDPEWRDLLHRVRTQVGCGQRIRLVRTSDLDIPSVFGVFRPVVALPESSRSWLYDRRQAVLQHEMVHVVRFDWPLRAVAQVARAIYWFNPLVWWAVQRLELEQEMACDEEVLSLGSRASSYACHLLGIARTAVQRPNAATAGLAMARRSHLEERIMRILNRSNHRRIGLAVILPAVILTAALVPAIASVQPAEPAASPRVVEPADPVQPAQPARPAPPAKPASPELKAAIVDMEKVETRIAPYLDRISDVEIDMQPIIERIEAIGIEIDHEAVARIEAEMAPLLAQIEDIEIDMKPYHEQMERMHEKLETMTFHIDDGTLDEVQEQIHEQMEALHESIGDIHIDMSEYQELMAQLQDELAPLHEEISKLTAVETARVHEEMGQHQELMNLEHEQMERMHAEMERIQEEMAPFEEEMERMGARIEAALISDVADALRSHFGAVASPNAPYREAAARIIDEGNIHIHNHVVELHASRSEVREILSDLFSTGRIGTQDAFDAALGDAVKEVSDLRIEVD
ncbi:MAG: M56 family metallopeptidase [Thermoanaerobaculales bacterium]|jgi:beta-lactamase regulating signal transducer with metallopeptidase domain/predicted  nucleic acid-binding Zn-ribbon protein|nr:M56 family metallopeptidase [Thermoanaerobaculales bacterium]